MELVLEHENMCKKIQQIVAEKINCNCHYSIRHDNDDNIVSIVFMVELNEYKYCHAHEVHIRELERCKEQYNGSVLPIANAIVQAVEVSFIRSIRREMENEYDKCGSI